MIFLFFLGGGGKEDLGISSNNNTSQGIDSADKGCSLADILGVLAITTLFWLFWSFWSSGHSGVLAFVV